jgi:hypothetical protein
MAPQHSSYIQALLAWFEQKPFDRHEASPTSPSFLPHRTHLRVRRTTTMQRPTPVRHLIVRTSVCSLSMHTGERRKTTRTKPWYLRLEDEGATSLRAHWTFPQPGPDELQLPRVGHRSSRLPSIPGQRTKRTNNGRSAPGFFENGSLPR